MKIAGSRGWEWLVIGCSLIGGASSAMAVVPPAGPLDARLLAVSAPNQEIAPVPGAADNVVIVRAAGVPLLLVAELVLAAAVVGLVMAIGFFRAAFTRLDGRLTSLETMLVPAQGPAEAVVSLETIGLLVFTGLAIVTLGLIPLFESLMGGDS